MLGVTASVGVSQSAVLASDVVYVNNSNRVEVAFSFPGTLLQTLTTPSQQSGAEDMTSKPRGSPDVLQLTSPQPNYMLGRTKIAVGGVGEDRGDASDDCPLPVKDPSTQDLFEYSLMEQRRLNISTARVRQGEREAPYFLVKTGRDGRF